MHSSRAAPMLCRVIVFGLSTGIAFAFSGCDKTSRSSGNSDPIIVFNKAEHDFGQVVSETPLQHEFVFKNRGGTRLVLDKISTSCGCLSASASKRSIEAGDTASVYVEYSGPIRGAVTQHVYITSNDPLTPMQQLTIRADVSNAVKFSGTKFQLGFISKGQQKHSQTVVYAQDPGFEIESIQSNHAQVSGHVSEVTVAEPDTGYRKKLTVGVVLEGDGPLGPIHGLLTLNTNAPETPSFSLSVMGHTVDDIEAVPLHAAITSHKPTTRFAIDLELRSRSQTPFAIFMVQLKNPESLRHFGTSLRPNISTRSHTHTLRLTGLTPPDVGPVGETLVITTDLADHDPVTIPIFGYIRP